MWFTLCTLSIIRILPRNKQKSIFVRSVSMVPYGVIVNASAIAVGGLLGAILGKFFPKRVLDALPPTFGLSAMSIAFVNVIKLNNLSVVILSLIVGTVIGELLRLEGRAEAAVGKLGPLCKEENRGLFLSLVVLFCASGTGIFGSMQAGMNADHSILYAKSILDFFTAFAFATTLGILVSSIAIIQTIVQLILFFFSSSFLGALQPHLIANFQAVGGLITFAIALKMLKLKELKVLNYTPALIVVFGMTKLWEVLM